MQGSTTAVEGVPEVVDAGQGGLHDAILAPDTGGEPTAYLSWVEAGEGGTGGVVGRARLDVTGPTAIALFEDLPTGTYAMKAFHDVDGDGEMATNPFGMPTEPFAFSNNAVGNMGPAGWDRAQFVASGDVAQTIDLAH